MHIAYFDEVKYCAGKQPYYWLGGIVVDAVSISQLESEVGELSKKCFGTSVLCRETEFHVADIFHRKANFKSWANPAERVEVILELAHILDKAPDLGKVFVRLDPALMMSSADIEEKAFMFFTERVEVHLRGKSGPGILIGDSENKKVSAGFTEKLSHYREHGTPYHFGIELRCLIDTVHFTESHHSRLLQLADLYVWLLQLAAAKHPAGHLATAVVSHVAAATSLYSPTRYKIWPTSASWLNR